MRIVADENIPYVREAFAELGEVITAPGRQTTADMVRDADMLLVRSITKVNAALLEGSKVRFVATATIGEDHVDKAYLASRGIAFSSAPGCNANSVGQYITAALLELAHAFDLDLSTMSLGIVGVGNVGRKVLQQATALGLTCSLNDPPLERATGERKYVPLDEIYDCDIVTLHVPLTKEGPDATYHMVDAAFLENLRPGCILLNSSRGPVVEGAALAEALDEGQVSACVLDVWEGEPNIDVDLLDRVFLGTPHIAGYSFDGKVNGTRQIYEAACRFVGIEPTWDPAPLLPAPECPDVIVDPTDPEGVLHAVRAVYDIRRDDEAMRHLIDIAPDQRGALFDRLRKEYPRRREFFNTTFTLTSPDPAIEARLQGLGFTRGS